MKRVVWVALLFVLSGCATSAPDRSARTASLLDDLETNNAKARAQVDAVLSSLEALLEAPPEKLRDAYDQYDRDVKKIHDYADRIRENDADLKKNGDNYLKKWQKDASSISDSELRAIAEERQNQIAEQNSTMRSTISIAADSFTEFLVKIDDIRKVIGNDLTPVAQASVRETTVARSARDESAVVKAAIENAERSIASLRSQITPTAQ